MRMYGVISQTRCRLVGGEVIKFDPVAQVTKVDAPENGVGHSVLCIFFFQAEDGIRDLTVTGVQTCALPIWIEGFAQLGVEAVYNLPVAVGSGWVEAAHGRLPVPAPATAILLEGVEVAGDPGPVEGEATTPTGAALVRVLSSGAPPARWRMVRSGWGAGQRNPPPYPNALRLLLAEPAAEAEC